MAQKIKKTITRVGYALMNVSESTGVISYGNATWFVSTEAGGREYSAEPSGELQEIYADGVVVYSAEENNGYDITLTLLAIIDDIDEKLLGNVVSLEGVAEYASPIPRPHFALFICEETTDGVGQVTIWYNCQVSKRPKNGGKTSEGSSFDAQFLELPISARPRIDNKLIRYTIKGKTLFSSVPMPTGSEN
jgi:phi13 family phage major tail protein